MMASFMTLSSSLSSCKTDSYNHDDGRSSNSRGNANDDDDDSRQIRKLTKTFVREPALLRWRFLERRINNQIDGNAHYPTQLMNATAVTAPSRAHYKPN